MQIVIFYDIYQIYVTCVSNYALPITQVSWLDGIISIGRGHVYGEQRVLSWQDPNPHNVSAVGVTAREEDGQWTFIRSDGEYIPIICMEQTAILYQILPYMYCLGILSEY